MHSLVYSFKRSLGCQGPSEERNGSAFAEESSEAIMTLEDITGEGGRMAVPPESCPSTQRERPREKVSCHGTECGKSNRKKGLQSFGPLCPVTRPAAFWELGVGSLV